MGQRAVRDHQAQLRGVRVHFRDHPGPTPDAPVAVLLHGLTGQSRDWDDTAAFLGTRYRVVAPDARGHGGSDWTSGAYQVDELVADVVALLGALRIPRAAVLGGLSMGGRTALNVAARHPALVARLVVVDIGPVVAPAGARRIAAGVGGPDVFDTVDDAVARARTLWPVPTDAVVRMRVENNLMLRDDGRWTWRYDASLRTGGTGLPRPDAGEQWSAVGRIQAPTLLVRGEESDVLDPGDARRMAEVIPDCRLVEVAGAGHTVPFDRPEDFLAAIGPFVLPEADRGRR